ncbi:HalOD1 output domain-containing protein [Natronosalvus halobius]|uniref:HalOD1 output domain-containing protein n=1 Tax=Natronosalvus halobius TaxID=2953746 RepID=UPI00209C8F6C|nr:HalOD1 output domain-containing protein [Natronosalvus halobius]USZ71800.1 hypothetical protein NGM15_00390 [Natronosalvus halobius]
MTIDHHQNSSAVSHRVVNAVARKEGIDPIDLEPLYHAIDPESLDRLFSVEAAADDRAADELTFTFAGYRVTVSADGSVDVATISEDGGQPSSIDRSATPSGEPNTPD